MGVFQSDCEVDWDICMIREISNCAREVCSVLFIQLPFKGGRVYYRTLAVANIITIIINIHDEVLERRKLS